MENLKWVEELAKRKGKKWRIPSEREYYESCSKVKIDSATMNEKDRKAARMWKYHPPDYDLIKNALEAINKKNGYR